MSEKHDGIALDDSFLFTGLTEAQRDFVSDNEEQIIHIISELVSKDDAVVAVESRRKEIVLVETNYARMF